jgi:D-arabinonate dehydratase
MKVTDVKVDVVSIPLKRPIYIATRKISNRTYSLIQVHTDSDISGMGLAYEAAGILIGTVLRDKIVGQDPFERAAVWNTLYGHQGTPHGRWGAALQAIGAIDMALWDIVGKALKQPLYRLLGGTSRQIPCYASAGYYTDAESTADLEHEMEEYVKRGFKAVKMRIGRLGLEHDLERVAAVRETIGNDVVLMVDANSAYNRRQATRVGRALETYGVFWFEEPLSPDDLHGNAMLARDLDLPVAGGELESGKYRFKELFDAKSFDIAQPDVSVCGGISEWMKIAALAEAYHIPLAPHSLHDVHIHLATATQNTQFIEFFDKKADLTKYSDLYTGYREPVGGSLSPSNTPGLGIEPNHEVLERYGIRSF